MAYNDPTGEFWFVFFLLAGVAGAGYSASQLSDNPTWGNAGWLALDIVTLPIPLPLGFMGRTVKSGAVVTEKLIGVGKMAENGGKVVGKVAKPIPHKLAPYERLQFTGYGKYRIMARDGGRGVQTSAIRHTLKNPTNVVHQVNGRIRYEGARATVIMEGRLVHNAWARSSKWTRLYQ